MKLGGSLTAFCLVVPLLAGTGAARAQTTGETVTYPQDNVRGGAVGARRPGSWIATSISAHRERMGVVLQQHGGASPQEKTTPDRHTLILTTFLEGLFNVLQDLATALQLAATASGTTTTGG